jgi:hypothetical protein
MKYGLFTPVLVTFQKNIFLLIVLITHSPKMFFGKEKRCGFE